jgi:ABC-type sugar transport system substrate-binding protein
MSRFVVVPLALMVAACVGLGCDSVSFTPPRPPGLEKLSGPTSNGWEFEMVLLGSDTPDRSSLGQIGRQGAGAARMSLRVTAPRPDDPPGRQAELIRRAAARGGSALIVESSSDPGVPEALEEVRARGIPIVVLGRPIPGAKASYPRVGPVDFAGSARALVAAVLEDARKANVPPDATAVIFRPERPDLFSDQTSAAVEKALKDAGVKQVDPLTFNGTPEDAQKVLDARLAVNPRVALIFTEEIDGLSKALDARERFKGKRPLIVAGYTQSLLTLDSQVLEQSAAIADRRVPRLGLLAFQSARSLAEGKPVAEQNELEIVVKRFSSQYAPAPATPDPTRLPEPVRAKMQKRDEQSQ